MQCAKLGVCTVSSNGTCENKKEKRLLIERLRRDPLLRLPRNPIVKALPSSAEGGVWNPGVVTRDIFMSVSNWKAVAANRVR